MYVQLAFYDNCASPQVPVALSCKQMMYLQDTQFSNFVAYGLWGGEAQSQQSHKVQYNEMNG